MAVDRVRMGIVGTGNIATLNVPGYLEHEQCDVVAVCDPRPDVLERRMVEWGVERGYTDLDQLLADDEIDAVEILSPTPLHAEHTIAALRAGKHVSCQKPIANDVGDARRMIAAAKESGRVFRVTENCCHYPPLRKARDLIREGAIGTPTVMRIKTVVGRTESRFQASLDPAGYTWRFNAESPGGHLFDDVMHKYAMALWLVDTDIRSVQSIVRQGPLFFEAPTVALFEYDRDDLLGMMEVSYAPDMFIRSDYYGADEFFEIQGTRGFIWVTRLVRQPAPRPRAGRALRGGRPPDVVRRARRVVRRIVPPFRGRVRRRVARGGGARSRPRGRDPRAAALLRRLPGVERAPAGRAVEHRRSGQPERLAAHRGEAARRRRGAVPAGGGPRRAPRTRASVARRRT